MATLQAPTVNQRCLLKLPAVIARIGLCRASIYNHIEAGLLPPPVKLSARAVGWPDNEMDLIIAARIAGKSDVELKRIVADIVKRRANAFDEATA